MRQARAKISTWVTYWCKMAGMRDNSNTMRNGYNPNGIRGGGQVEPNDEKLKSVGVTIIIV